MENSRIKAVRAALSKDFPQQSEALSESSPMLVFDAGEWEIFLYSYAHHRIYDFMHKYHVGDSRIHYEAAYILMAIDADELDAANMILDLWKTAARENDYNWQPCAGNLDQIKLHVDAGNPVFMRKGKGTFNEYHSHCFLKEGRYHRGAGGGSSLDKLEWAGWEYADPDPNFTGIKTHE